MVNAKEMLLKDKMKLLVSYHANVRLWFFYHLFRNNMNQSKGLEGEGSYVKNSIITHKSYPSKKTRF